MKPPFLNNKPSPKTKRNARANTATDHSQSSSPSFFKFARIIFILTLCTAALLYLKRDQWGISSIVGNALSDKAENTPDPDQYAALTSKLEANRKLLKMRYLSAATRAQQAEILTEASTLLEENLPSMMRCWLGHPWDFNGTATIPGEGKIACGYFVSVIMRDAGFKINRIKVAQQPSQNIIRTFVDHSDNYEIKTNTPYAAYLDHINKKYEGIHIVGLDKHVAFIVIKNGEMRFIHSGGLKRQVVDEGRNEAYSLEKSNYRVISNISRNKNVIKKWILGEPFQTGGTEAASR